MVHSNPSRDKLKPKSDRHLKVNGDRRRIRLPVNCAETVDQLKKALGHCSLGETIEWVLNQAKESIDDVLKVKPTSPAPPVTSSPFLNLNSTAGAKLDSKILAGGSKFKRTELPPFEDCLGINLDMEFSETEIANMSHFLEEI